MSVSTWKLLQQSPEDLAAHILAKQNAGADVFVFDSCNENDLERVYQVSMLVKQPKVFCGSAGFAYFVGQESPCGVMPTFLAKRDGVDLISVVCGTRNQRTKEQMLCVVKRYHRVFCLFDSEEENLDCSSQRVLDDVVAQIEQGAKEILVSVSGMYDPIGFELQDNDSKGEKAHRIAVMLGELMYRLFSKHQMKGIIATGGDTAQQVCLSLGAYGLIPTKELEPGIPLGVLVGGIADGVLMVTKSGGFGSDSVLADSIEYIRGEI